MSEAGVPCPECGLTSSSVVDKRDGPSNIRRRRECPQGHRFTTLEKLAKPQLKINRPRIMRMRKDGYKLREIAKATGTSISTVWWALNDGLR